MDEDLTGKLQQPLGTALITRFWITVRQEEKIPARVVTNLRKRD